MNIIQKLGLPEIPDEIKTLEDCSVVHEALAISPYRVDIISQQVLSDVKILLRNEQNRREMLEALIRFVGVHSHGEWIPESRCDCMACDGRRSIEQNTGMKLAEIKDILEGD